MRMTMKNHFRHIFVSGIALLALTFASIKCYPQKAVLSLDTSSIRIGERVQLRLNATLPKSASIYWPAISDTLTGAVEVASKSKVDTNATSRKDFINYSQTILITSFDTGFHYIPPITIYYAYTGDTTRHELLSEGVYLKVRTVEVDTTQAIRDIRGPMQAPITLAELAPYLAGIAIIGLIIGLIWYYIWRKRMNKPLFPLITRTVGPPWQVALESLALLQEKKLWQTAYDSAELQPDSRPILANILVQADYAKFAKAIPQKAENEMSMTSAIQFIESTKPIPAGSEVKPTETNETQTPVSEIKA
jgi:hypothetical protein